MASKQDAQQLAKEAKATAPKSRLAESMDVAEAGYSAKAGRAGKDIGKPGKNFSKIAKGAAERYGSKAAGERVAGAVLNKLRHPTNEGTCPSCDCSPCKCNESMEESGLQAYLGNKKYGKQGMDALRKAGREHAGKDKMDQIRNRYDKMDEADMEEGNAFSGAVAKAKANGIQKGEKINVGGKTYPVKEAGKPMTPKQKSFAKLAPPADKITFADKIAGAKKEVDEMLGDVAAKAMKSAVKITDEGDVEDFVKGGGKITYGKPQKGPRKPGLSLASKHIGGSGDKMKPSRTGRGANTHGKPVVAVEDEIEEGFAEMDAWLKNREKEKGTGRFDKRKVSTGTVYTRKPETFANDDEEETSTAPKKRGRPMGKPKGPERITKGAWKHKAGRVAEGDTEVCSECGQPLVEKAKSKAQQKFMGMVHATQKGEKAPSKEVAKVAKEMPKKAAKDFASTKQKGLPEKVKAKKESKEEIDEFFDQQVTVKGGNANSKSSANANANASSANEEKVEETTVAGSVATASTGNKSKGGMQYGKGVYEGFNNKVENMIAEGVQMSEHALDGDEESITITATGEDVHRLKELLKLAGLASQSGTCPTCGNAECGCNELDENSPDWPTNTEMSQDALQYSGGLNGKKSTGQTTTPVIAGQLGRQSSMEESVKLERSLFKTWKNYKG